MKRARSAVILLLLTHPLLAAAAPGMSQKTVPPKTAPPKTTAPSTGGATAAAPTLDLDGLSTRLKQTKAIGLMTKLSLKNQVDDLMDKFRRHYSGKSTPTCRIYAARTIC
jgi:hypothetical protein